MSEFRLLIISLNEFTNKKTALQEDGFRFNKMLVAGETAINIKSGLTFNHFFDDALIEHQYINAFWQIFKIDSLVFDFSAAQLLSAQIKN